jgi:GH15 family glucan-1,4-alpha-glucosidase
VSEKYPPIADYGLIGDCQTSALVSRQGSIDWCCLPRFDSGSCFGRLLDWERGGFFSVEPRGGSARARGHRTYVDGTLVLETIFRVEGGEARLIDCMPVSREGPTESDPRILRMVEGIRGSVEFDIRIVPRFDYGAIDAWVRRQDRDSYSLIGGDDGLLICGDPELEAREHELGGSCSVRPGERQRIVATYCDPAAIDRGDVEVPDPDQMDRDLDDTLAYWREWSGRLSLGTDDDPEAVRSAIVLKALTYDRSGALAAAPTTSLPETPGGKRNWDYRYAWIRDSTLASRSLGDLGCEAEADAFRRFIERSAAGNADDLQIMFGVGGERRLSEMELELDGYRGARPVRIGNGAAEQLQLDMLGQLVEQSWRWYEQGHEPDDDYWRFIVEIANAAADRWREKDRGAWEWRADPKHFTHSKALCWVALDKALKLAKACMRKAPEQRWRAARDEIREAIERRGYEKKRGIFTQAFEDGNLDAALLRLPMVDFIDYDDERMIRTTDAIADGLEIDGLIRRYTGADGLPGQEGAFLPVCFWLVEVLARQGRAQEAREFFDRAVATANGLGLFPEEYDPRSAEMLGNFPQALTHLSHIEAALALAQQAQATTATPAG